MLELKKSEFKPENYRKLNLLTNHRNGNQTYSFECACSRCGGTTKVQWSSLDNQNCWKCHGTGKEIQKLHVLTDENWNSRELERAEAARKFRDEQAKRDAEQVERHINEGYKKVDFKVAGWFFGRAELVDFNHDKYYIVKRESAKAVLISYIDDLVSGVSEEIWFPKSAIVR